MALVRHLDGAPIFEAIIDIQVSLDKGFDCEGLLSKEADLRPLYPHIKKKYEFAARIDVENVNPFETTSDKKILGYAFVSENESNIVQFRLDGFTRNQLQPYSNWDDFEKDAMKYWALYKEITGSPEISRVAVRYINRFDIPMASFDFQKVFSAPPIIPDKLPTLVQDYTSRLVLVDPDNKCHVALVQRVEPNIDPDLVSVIVDIDAWKNEGVSLESIEKDLETLHNLKNDFFFNTLTEETIGRFE